MNRIAAPLLDSNAISACSLRVKFLASLKKFVPSPNRSLRYWCRGHNTERATTQQAFHACWEREHEP